MSDDVFIKKAPQKILFSVLNWGLGHATRSIPLIEHLLSIGHDLVLASDGKAGLFLKKRFPQLKYYELTPYNIRYNTKQIEWSVLKQSIQIARTILKEHKETGQICEIENISWVVSDSRFGVRHKDIHSTIISHQLNLISDNKVFSFIGNRINKYLLEKFDECWIPDDQSCSLSGLLSQASLSIPVRHVGCQSRFKFEQKEQDIDVLIILSGPEPKRTVFEQKIKKTLKNSLRMIVLVRGLVDEQVTEENWGSIFVYNYQEGKDLNQLLNRSRLVIGRAGYSSIMDYIQLSKKAILIPTPGQTEQLYLAKHLDSNPNFSFLEEDHVESELSDLVARVL